MEGVAVVTGANKGVGLAVVRALCKDFDGIVYLTARDEKRGFEAIESLGKEGLHPKFHQLDVESMESIERFRDYIKRTHGGLDVLVNNAGMAFKMKATESAGEQAEITNRVNFFGTLNVSNELFPLLRENARVVNLSSIVGHLPLLNGQEPQATELRKQFADPNLKTEKLVELVKTFVSLCKEGKHHENGWPNTTYGVSKIAVSALTRIQQRELDLSRPNNNILVNSIFPGYISTDMTSFKGVLTVDQGAEPIAWLALLPPNVQEPRGEFVWHDKKVLDWVNGKTPPLY